MLRAIYNIRVERHANIFFACVFCFFLVFANEAYSQENLSQSQNDPLASAAVEIKPKTAAEIMAEIDRITQDLQKTADREIEPDSVLSEDQDQDLDQFIESEDLATEPLIDQGQEQSPDELEGLFEKVEPLDIRLMVDGAPEEELNEFSEMQKISGQLVPERRRIARRRYSYRWVLKTPHGERIPLKSNLKLLQEVKKDKLLDGYVTLTGKYTDSGFANELRFFVVESVVATESIPENTDN